MMHSKQASMHSTAVTLQAKAPKAPKAPNAASAGTSAASRRRRTPSRSDQLYKLAKKISADSCDRKEDKWEVEVPAAVAARRHQLLDKCAAALEVHNLTPAERQWIIDSPCPDVMNAVHVKDVGGATKSAQEAAEAARQHRPVVPYRLVTWRHVATGCQLEVEIPLSVFDKQGGAVWAKWRQRLWRGMYAMDCEVGEVQAPPSGTAAGSHGAAVPAVPGCRELEEEEKAVAKLPLCIPQKCKAQMLGLGTTERLKATLLSKRKSGNEAGEQIKQAKKLRKEQANTQEAQPALAPPPPALPLPQLASPLMLPLPLPLPQHAQEMEQQQEMAEEEGSLLELLHLKGPAPASMDSSSYELEAPGPEALEPAAVGADNAGAGTSVAITFGLCLPFGAALHPAVIGPLPASRPVFWSDAAPGVIGGGAGCSGLPSCMPPAMWLAPHLQTHVGIAAVLPGNLAMGSTGSSGSGAAAAMSRGAFSLPPAEPNRGGTSQASPQLCSDASLSSGGGGSTPCSYAWQSAPTDGAMVDYGGSQEEEAGQDAAFLQWISSPETAEFLAGHGQPLGSPAGSSSGHGLAYGPLSTAADSNISCASRQLDLSAPRDLSASLPPAPPSPAGLFHAASESESSLVELAVWCADVAPVGADMDDCGLPTLEELLQHEDSVVEGEFDAMLSDLFAN